MCVRSASLEATFFFIHDHVRMFEREESKNTQFACLAYVSNLNPKT
jgi:hypothetical protein